jgi:DNA-binding beta-propeller fold protein YncE
LVGEISGMHLAHGVVLVNKLDRGFISDGAGNQVVILRISNLKALSEVKTGNNPDCILYDPVSKRIFTFNGGTHDATVINPVNGTVVATIPMGGRPEYAVADAEGMIYVSIGDANEIAALDSRSLTIKTRWPIAPAAMPTALAMDREHRRLFIGGRNKVLAIMDADNGRIVQTFPIGFGVDTNIYEPDKHLEFTSTREGTIHIFHENSPKDFSVVEVVRTQPGAHTMALDPKTQHLFLDTADFHPGHTPNTGVFDHPAGGFHSMGIAVPGTFRLLVYGSE